MFKLKLKLLELNYLEKKMIKISKIYIKDNFEFKQEILNIVIDWMKKEVEWNNKNMEGNMDTFPIKLYAS